MAITLSEGLKNYMLEATTQGSISEALSDGVICIYASGGTVPDVDSTISGATLIAVISDNGLVTTANCNDTGGTGNGLEFDAAANGILSKEAAQVWKGAIETVTDGTTADFYRFITQGDEFGTGGTAHNGGTSTLRFQGTVGQFNEDLNLSNPIFNSADAGNDPKIDVFSLTMV